MSQYNPTTPPPRDDGLTPRDVTILRPRPGAGRRPVPPAGQPAPAPVAPPAPASVSVPANPAPFQNAAAFVDLQSASAPASLDEFANGGATPLVQAAVPLLALA